MANERVFVSWPGYSIDDSFTGRRLVELGFEVILEPKFGARSADEVIELANGATAAIVSTDPFTAEVLSELDGLKIIARVGVGTDSIDRSIADNLGVGISITPGLNAETVADHTLALMLGLIRKVPAQDTSTRGGAWDRVGALMPSELWGKTVGLIGAGTIGSAVARRVLAFGAEVIFFDDFVDQLEGTSKASNLEDLLKRSDVVSLHAPLADETHHLIGQQELELLGENGYLINTSRGPLIDEDALLSALTNGTVAGAALDVFEVEPPNTDRFSNVPNLICAPHIGGISKESVERMTRSATQSVISALSGEKPATLINSDAASRIHP